MACKSSQRQVNKSRILSDAIKSHSKICPFLSMSFAPMLQILHLVVFACCHSMLSSTTNQDKTSTQTRQMSKVNKDGYSKDKKSDHKQSRRRSICIYCQCYLKSMQLHRMYHSFSTFTKSDYYRKVKSTSCSSIPEITCQWNVVRF